MEIPASLTKCIQAISELVVVLKFALRLLTEIVMVTVLKRKFYWCQNKK